MLQDHGAFGNHGPKIKVSRQSEGSISFAAFFPNCLGLRMIIVLSPAKNLNESPLPHWPGASVPVLEQESRNLVAKLKGMSAARLAKLMGISAKLAALNRQRYQHWDAAVRKPAIMLFNGEAYRGLDASTLDSDDLRFAQRHLRILSGLYGVLRPADLIAPHRLEMGTRLAVGKGVKNLYAFWGGRITRELNLALHDNNDDVLVNLASEEYFRSVRPAQLNAKIITPVFKEERSGKLHTVPVFAKHQRGAMARWAIQRRVLDPEDLKQYSGDGYSYRPEASTADEWLFTR
jgi:cytoplasmic iron level regulating protein YaaA (DUF328/UPF0246 family)